MNPKFKSYAVHYIEGALASAFNGGIAALAGVVGPAVGRLLSTVNIPDLTPNQLLSTFAGAAIGSAIMYFKANPLPVDSPAV